MRRKSTEPNSCHEVRDPHWDPKTGLDSAQSKQVCVFCFVFSPGEDSIKGCRESGRLVEEREAVSLQNSAVLLVGITTFNGFLSSVGEFC